MAKLDQDDIVKIVTLFNNKVKARRKKTGVSYMNRTELGSIIRVSLDEFNMMDNGSPIAEKIMPMCVICNSNVHVKIVYHDRHHCKKCGNHF